MNNLVYIMLAMCLFLASCKNTPKEKSLQSDTINTTDGSSFREITSTTSDGIGDEGVAPTDGVPDEEIPDGQYAYEDDNSSAEYSYNTDMYDDNGDREIVMDDNYYYQKGYSEGQSSGNFDRGEIYWNDCEFIKGSYRTECEMDFPKSDLTNKEHYLIYKQGFLDGWNSIEGALD